MAVIKKPKANAFDEHLASVKLPVKSTTTSVCPNGVEQVTEEQLATVKVPLPHCTVTVGNSFSKNLGDFNNAKISVMVSIPCQFSELDSTFDLASTWVENKLNDKMEELEQSLMANN